ncbi:putative GPI anchored protein [Gongronella butleri]|nr:putative GPI anchored protein [Gongronella butleri]
MKNTLLIICVGVVAHAALACSFVHPGLLHTQADFDRVKANVAAGKSPWIEGYDKLVANWHASVTYKSNPQAIVYRGADGVHTQNYGTLYNDIAAAYALALRWKITGNDTFADASIGILNGWGKTLKQVTGSSDRFLAAGIYGYQIANAAEIMRTYSKWAAADFAQFKSMMVNVFYPVSHDFLVNHNGAGIDHYWANWDLCNIAGIMATGVLTDNATMYDEALTYFKSGGGNGAINKAIWKLYDTNLSVDGFGQNQEAGRDQGHAGLDMALLGVVAQQAFNQGDDMFAYEDNRILRAAEYFACYNLGNDVPYTTFSDSLATQTVISNGSRGNIRPAWDLLYSHYGELKGHVAKYTLQYRDYVRAAGNGSEGGGGNYGPNSGGYDQLGYGTLMYALKEK